MSLHYTYAVRESQGGYRYDAVRGWLGGIGSELESSENSWANDLQVPHSSKKIVKTLKRDSSKLFC
jgi:hypothetical protein